MKKVQSTHIIIALLAVAALGLAWYSSRSQQVELPWPRAAYNDGAPLGGRGYRRVLEWLGYKVARVDTRLAQMPADARVWLILDNRTKFSRAETEMLFKWVEDGGTLIWAAPPNWGNFSLFGGAKEWTPWQQLGERFKIERSAQQEYSNSLPTLSKLPPSAPNRYWSDVKNASASTSVVEIHRGHLEIAGDVRGAHLARIDVGKGRIFVSGDALLFTNYALDSPETGVLATNLIRAHVLPSPQNAVYFDERQHGDDTPVGQKDANKSLPYYLWNTPQLRYALLQLAFAATLLWMLFGRRLGRPVPLPEREFVTRASQFAGAMGTLLHKSHRPKVAAQIIGEEFRRTLARRMGMSPHDSDETLASRAALLSGLPEEHIARLLFKARTPGDDEAELLDDAQQMEYVLRRLSR
jgi:hypothetical protein